MSNKLYNVAITLTVFFLLLLGSSEVSENDTQDNTQEIVEDIIQDNVRNIQTIVIDKPLNIVGNYSK